MFNQVFVRLAQLVRIVKLSSIYVLPIVKMVEPAAKLESTHTTVLVSLDTLACSVSTYWILVLTRHAKTAVYAMLQGYQVNINADV